MVIGVDNSPDWVAAVKFSIPNAAVVDSDSAHFCRMQTNQGVGFAGLRVRGFVKREKLLCMATDHKWEADLMSNARDGSGNEPGEIRDDF